MCGIVCTNMNVPEKQVADSVRHRGTHEPRFTKTHGFTFCHTLMPVQGDKPAHQPIVGEAGHVLIYQGELWEHAGYKSDTEYLYKKLCKGNPLAVVRGLNGMFAFVFCDGVDLYFCSDILGEQPLYYHCMPGGFFPSLSIASELKQLCALGIDCRTVLPCLPGKLYRYNMASGALCTEVYHAFDHTQHRATTYNPQVLRRYIAHSVALKYKATNLQKSALLLSGGVDSAIMAYELSRLGLVEAFTVSSNVGSVDFTNAEKTAARCGLNLTKVVCETFDTDISIAITETRNRSMVEEYVCHLALAKCLADKGYRVVFSGSGADELFCGYSYYLRFLNKGRYHEVQKRFIENYHKMDLRILNKVYMSNAVEVRNPFLTKTLVDYCLTLDVVECLIGKGIMKKALRESYRDLIDSADNKKLIAVETMGVKAYYEELYGVGNPRIYYERFKQIFTDKERLAELIRRARHIKYKIVP